MAKFKVGDRVCIVNPVSTHGEYENGNEGEITEVEEEGVMVFFDHYEEGNGSMYVFNEEFEVITADEDKTPESFRNSILDIRSKREALQKVILQLDEQEKESVEKLKEMGFILYEDNVSKEAVATENKAVLYAEDIEEDMTDPDNWKASDLILCVNGAGWEDWIDEGEVAEMVEELSSLLCLNTNYGVRMLGSPYYEDFKFHSRPVK